MEIKYLQRDEINDHQWDTCLYTAVNGMIYGYSWYLDEVCDEWGALVLGDYKAVMPLPWRKKYGINYLYQPFFCQQLGVFSNIEINTELINSFFKAIPKKFRFIDIQVNIFSQPLLEGAEVKQRANYHLPLILPYEKLVSGYNENTRRNIRKAVASGYQLHDNPDANTIINLYIENYGAKTPEIKEADYERLARLVNTCWKKGTAKTYGIYDEHNMLCAGAIFLTDTKNIYYLLGGADSNGRDNGALHLLFDGVIKKHAEQDLVLDFEGSDIEGIARFYKGFGAAATHYYKITENRLPFWLRWLKK